MNIKFENIGKVNIYLKPTLLRGWYIIGETKKCLIVRKYFKKRYGSLNYVGDCYYLSKKLITKVKPV